MAIEYEKLYSDRVELLPEATLGDGTRVQNYVTATVFSVRGVSGDYRHDISSWVSFSPPENKTAETWESWSSISGSRPSWVEDAMDKYFTTVTGQIISLIESDLNAPIDVKVSSWSS